jgi:hypothetical protein
MAVGAVTVSHAVHACSHIQSRPTTSPPSHTSDFRAHRLCSRFGLAPQAAMESGGRTRRSKLLRSDSLDGGVLAPWPGYRENGDTMGELQYRWEYLDCSFEERVDVRLHRGARPRTDRESTCEEGAFPEKSSRRRSSIRTRISPLGVMRGMRRCRADRLSSVAAISAHRASIRFVASASHQAVVAAYVPHLHAGQ